MPEATGKYKAKVYDVVSDEWVPLFDDIVVETGSNTVKGIVNLSDATNSTLNAENGGTAATPLAVAKVNQKVDDLADTVETKIPNSPGAVKTDNIADGAVTSSKIPTGAITTEHILDGTILEQDIHQSAVTADKLAPNSVTTVKIVNGAVTADKLAANSVTTNKIVNGNVTNEKLADACVTSDKIMDNTIQYEDLSKDLQNLINSAGEGPTISVPAANRVVVSTDALGITTSNITTTELNQLDGINTNQTIQAQLNGKQATITGAASSVTTANLTPNTVAIADANGKIMSATAVSVTELGYLDGVTGAIQTQLNGKASAGHTHNYAGASTPGGPATSANRLATARTVQTDLGSEREVSFDGSANITPGVKGTLPIAHGGTGATTARAAEYNIMSQIRTVTSNVADSDMFVCKATAPDATNGATYARSFSTVYNAIKDKTDDLYLPLTGGVLSGTVRGPGFTVQSSFMNNPGSTPSESQYGNQLIFSTQNNTRIGFVRGVHQAPDGATGVEFNAAREIGGVNQFAGMRFLIDASGNYYVTPTNDKFINAFRDGFNITNADIRDFVYPVGSYYISNNSTSPAQRFGGEWLEVGDDNSERGFFLYAHHGNKTGGTTRHRHIMNTGKAVNDSQYIMDFDNPNTFLASAILGRSDAYKEVTYNGAMQYAGNDKPGASGFSLETGPGTSKMSRIRLDMTSEPVINVTNGGQKEYNYEFLPGQPYESGEVLPPYREVFAWIRTA